MPDLVIKSKRPIAEWPCRRLKRIWAGSR